MARIAWVEEQDATGEVRSLYDYWLAQNPGRKEIPAILKCMSQSPGLLRGVFEISYRVQFAEGHLSRRVKELIATWVSALNQCPY
ncbi:MAG: carboxymuconolactone decarboxylase family protein [Planctomycetaceae bacterium]